MNIFATEATYENSELILLPVPWEATTSYGRGTAKGPQAILQASAQVDLFDLELGEFYKRGIFLNQENPELLKLNEVASQKALSAIEDYDENQKMNSNSVELVNEVNQHSYEVNEIVYKESQKILNDGKILGLIGGDHSSPYSAIQALSEQYKGGFGILHIDAHADLRNAYQGFEHSHASIMYNVMNLEKAPKKLVQVGIRDFCQEEFDMSKNDSRIHTFFDQATKEQLFKGRSWQQECADMIKQLPENVYISFDIDGLSPEFCPHTGTPVPGGLSFDQAQFLIAETVKSGRKIIGFDLCEVAPGETELDANIGSRILFKLCGWTLKSREAHA